MGDAPMSSLADDVALNDTWTHAMARACVRPLIGTGVKPNHLTTLRLVTGVAACGLLALGSPVGTIWGGVLWLVSCFLDRADGELARIGDMRSHGGHVYDYVSDVLTNSLFFLGVGVGLRHSWLGEWGPILGVVACIAMLLCCWLAELYEQAVGPGVKTWNGAFGFHPDDGLYLLAPLAWLGWLAPVLVAASVCTAVIAAITAARLFGLKRTQRDQGASALP